MNDVLAYLDRSIATFERDPPATEFQRGYLSALQVARAEIGTLAARQSPTLEPTP